MSSAALHQELVRDHDRHPHRAGLREPFGAEVLHTNPTCGDQVQLRVALDGEVVHDVSWEALGCAVSRASASMMTDVVVGLTVSQALARRERFAAVLHAGAAPGEEDEELLGDAVALAGVGRHALRVRCALLGWSAFTDAAVRALAAGG